MAEDIRTNTILNGRYQVQRKLGQGGMGAVYLAQDLRNRRPVAVKVARLAGPNDRAQFRREATYLQKLHHHGLPRVWDIFSDTQQDFLVMEYIPGEDLESLVQAKGPQPEWLVLRWAEELLDSLAFLHRQDPPIIHRDVKPGNLKLRQDETLVLVDFGIAKEFVPGMDTFAGATAVTPGYSPLEQYSGTNTDARSDLYAVGATMYFLLSGLTPAAAPDRATGDARLVSLLDVAPKTSPATDMLVRRAMSVARDQRWSSAAEMRHAADLAAQQLNAKPATRAATVPAAPVKPSQPVKATGNSGRKGGWLALLALVVAAVLAVALFMTRGNQTPDATPDPTLAATDAVAVAVTAPPTETATATPPKAAPTSPVLPADTALPIAVTAAAPPAPITVTEVISGPTGLVTVTRVIEPPGVTDGGPPTSTPIGTFTPTPSPTNPPPATRAPAVAAQAPVAAPSVPAGAITVALVSPNSGDASSTTQTFEWQVTAGELAPNQAYEMRFWKNGLDALRDGFGPEGTTRSNRQAVNLQAADAAGLIQPGDYLWGVLLVQTTPTYRPIELISDTRTFRYERPSGGQPAPTSPVSPPPTIIP